MHLVGVQTKSSGCSPSPSITIILVQVKKPKQKTPEMVIQLYPTYMDMRRTLMRKELYLHNSF